MPGNILNERNRGVTGDVYQGTGLGFPDRIGRIKKAVGCPPHSFHLVWLKELNMANGSTATMRIIGIALAVIGLGLAFWAYRISDTFGSRITHAIMGSYSDREMAFYISGAACFIAGIFLLLKK